MLDERAAELIQADIDGELTGREHVELRSVLAASEEARRFRDEMRQITRLLEQLPPLEPPAGLAERVARRAELPPRPRGWLAVLTDAAWFQPASYGLAMAAGVLLAVGFMRLQPAGPGDIENLAGSMVRHGQPVSVGEAATSALAIESADVIGSVALKPLGNAAWAMEFELDSAAPVELKLFLGGSGMRFGGLADPATGMEAIEVSQGEVRMTTQGRRQFVVFLRHSDGPDAGVQAIRIEVSRQDETLFQGFLASAAEPA